VNSEPKLALLARASIELVPADMPKHYIATRGEFVALIERAPEGFGRPGTAGLLTTHGLAPLVWRNGEARWVARGFDQAATPEQIEALRAFQADLVQALG
jgi:hypothetical protein